MLNLDLDLDLVQDLDLDLDQDLDLGWIWGGSGVDLESGPDPAPELFALENCSNFALQRFRAVTPSGDILDPFLPLLEPLSVVDSYSGKMV